MSQSPPNRVERSGLIVFCLAAMIGLSFALYTDQRWEDYYITFRVSKHLAAGEGLVFQVGERLHAFTSPLGVLLPALASWLVGRESDDAALWAFRIVSIAAFAGAATLVWLTARRWGWSRFTCLFAAALVMTDAKSVGYSINGMETGLMLFFLAMTVYTFTESSRHAGWRLGAAWGGLMWTRPDSFVYFGSLALGFWLFPAAQKLAANRRALLEAYLRAGLVCALIYAPWFLWAWSYYGSPIPHTIVAKGLGHRFPHWPVGLFDLLTLPFRAWGKGGWDAVLMPTYYVQFGGWPVFAAYAGRTLLGLGLLAVLLPRMRPEVRALSLALNLCLFYLLNVYLYPWYMPPIAVLAFIVLGGVGESLLRRVPWRSLLLAPGIAALGLTTSLLLASAVQLKWQQRLVEGQRKQIGLWLRENRSSDTDTVFLESLGYIGYFSQLKMLDFPGLSSNEVVAARRKVGDNWLDLIEVLQPHWVIQRPGELHSDRPDAKSRFLAHYLPVKIFDIRAQIAAVSFLPGRSFLRFDQSFLIYRRIAATDAQPRP